MSKKETSILNLLTKEQKLVDSYNKLIVLCDNTTDDFNTQSEVLEDIKQAENELRIVRGKIKNTISNILED